MKFSNKLLLASAACAVCALPAVGQAETITTKTVVHQKEIPADANKVNFSAFDLNGDHILSMREVGKKLFYVFDTDGNEVIDNLEFDRKNVVTIIPMERDTYRFVDYDNDGDTDQATYTYETFIDRSMLMRFDKGMDGLSPADFIEMSFLELDDDKSKVIELEEWEEEYHAKVIPDVAEQERYN